jgi:hypothetical protein
MWNTCQIFSVMAGLVPAIHVLEYLEKKDVDARHKAGHDDECEHCVDLIGSAREQ